MSNSPVRLPAFMLKSPVVPIVVFVAPVDPATSNEVVPSVNGDGAVVPGFGAKLMCTESLSLLV